MKVSMRDQIHDEKSSTHPSPAEGSLIHARLPPKDINWWRSAVLYQVYPRSFCDARGDGIGDIKGLIQRLTEIKSLGVDAIWICPFFKSPMEDFGYDIEDHCAVDPLFGQQEDVYELIKTAHTLGLRVLIDLVISHTSERHPWFKESRLSRDSEWSDYYVWADPLSDGSPPNNWLSIFGGSAWKWDTRRRQYYLHNFLVSQPDLNFHNPDVQDHLLEVARFWLELGVDGFRLDTVNFYFHDQQLRHNPPAHQHDNTSAHESNPYGWQEHLYDKNRPEVSAFLERLRALLDTFPGSVSLGEIGESPSRSLDLLVEYTQPNRLHLCYSFDLLAPKGDARYWRGVISRFEDRAASQGSSSWPCWAFSNHDVTRAATRLCPQDGNVRATGELLLALLLSLRGTPCIYQGEELALPEAEVPYDLLVDPYGIEFWPDFKGRDGCRTPYPWNDNSGAGFTRGEPWLPISDTHQTLNFNHQDQDTQSTLNIARTLIRLRASSLALQRGSIELINNDSSDHDDDALLAFVRTYEDEYILCVFNPSTERLRLVYSDLSSYEILSAARGVNFDAEHLVLPPQTWAFLQR